MSFWPVLQHILNPSVTLLDLLISNLVEITSTPLSTYFLVLPPFHLNSCSTIPPLSSSDHKGLLVSLHNDVVIERPLSSSSWTVWCYSQANFDLDGDLLNESDWNSMFSNASNVTQLWSTWQKRFLEIMEICIPKEWLPSKSISLGSLHHCLVQWTWMKRRNSLFRSFKHTGSVNRFKEEYKRQRNLDTTAIRHTKTSFLNQSHHICRL